MSCYLPLLINDLFDIMNGKIPKHGLIPSSPKLRVIDEFLDILDETESQTPTRCFVSSVTGESFRVSLQSTKDLIQLLFDAGYEYVLTSKFNQDCLERFFGIVRMAGGGEEHPTVINFMALYRMLSVYTPTRRIQNGNCEADSEETVLVSYVDCLKAKSKEASHDRKSLSLNIEENILEKIWMNEDLPNCIDHNDYAKPSRDDCIIYHFCGYMLFKVKRFTQCKECIKTLSMNGIPPKESLLTDIVSYGFMKYVSLEMFSLFKEVERVINSEVNDGVISNLFWNVLDKIFIMSAPIGCNLHAEHLVPQLVHYFIVTRMHFIAREKNKKLSENKTRNARKKSKLC